MYTHQYKFDDYDELIRDLVEHPKPLRDFIQMDGWANEEPGDPIMSPDDDGDVLLSSRQREPQRSGTTVRIHIAANAERDDVLRILRKQLAWLERDPTLGFTDPTLGFTDNEPPF